MPEFWPSTIAAPLAVLVALALDRAFGEPPARCHPVVAMGHYLSFMGRRIAPLVDEAHKRPALSFILGGLAWCLGLVFCVSLAVVAAWLMTGWPWWAQALALGVLLKPMLSWRMLRDEVRAVETALAESLPAGRERLSWLVSRDVSHLGEAAVRESAIETLAENLNDSVVAPLFWFAVAGLPGAALYRFANTADAMWGYPGERNGRDWTWAGKWAARADDVLSWLPARLTAALLAVPTARQRLRHLPAQAGLTPSPNGGWPMAAMALALNVRLAKPGVYILHPTGRSPTLADTAQALHLSARVVAGLAAFACVAALFNGWRHYS
ncbi:adenosylcobinamide-phosphate synthase [Hydrogenophaga palleronii]|uniref:Cobalamin biosynthesis protein CobD n=1 Tax=Hydrogenophaga palleronii TaxID=65655 RepID=A0ABU1WHE4_9BURK|nr:adenosylcobinamide-phosphate synthase CbiB [Hydrogenophaga palleronii]MDR7148676.1 adenosylcobinamide-phosphate synthase [Hydrogenophaga palleronii]